MKFYTPCQNGRAYFFQIILQLHFHLFEITNSYGIAAFPLYLIQVIVRLMQEIPASV